MTNAPRIADLPPLTEEQVDDALFRIKDRLWALLGDYFDKHAETEQLSYADLARRIGRPRSQVQRWLASSHNMTVGSAGLLAEGLNADLEMLLRSKSYGRARGNYAHPCEDASAFMTLVPSIPKPNAAFVPNTVQTATSTTSTPAEVHQEWSFQAAK